MHLELHDISMPLCLQLQRNLYGLSVSYLEFLVVPQREKFLLENSWGKNAQNVLQKKKEVAGGRGGYKKFETVTFLLFIADSRDQMFGPKNN